MRTNPRQPITTKSEWGGPIGGFFLVLGLPLLVCLLSTFCNAEQCALPLTDIKGIPNRVKDLIVKEALPQLPQALALEVAWIAAHALFYLAPIGRVVQGFPLRDGRRLSYRINAIHAFIVSHAVILALHFAKVIQLSVLADAVPGLVLGITIICFVMSLALYVYSYRSDDVMTALGGNSGNVFQDFWVGRELNPRTGFLDWKFMCELRPGLIGWSILNWAFVAKSIELGHFTPSIALLAFFHSFYVFDGLLLEAGNLTMMDIVTDGFGFMLCFGDLQWVPFIYTLQAKYLAYHPVQLSPVYVALCAALILLGYTIFRGANTQKDRFRTNPTDPRVVHLKVMKTSRGKSLLISGFWGVCRHPNYVGDWLMALGWAALTGTGAAIPYFHALYFAILLIHRQFRDEESMREKYGDKDWKAFCAIVPYRLIPYVY